MKVPFYDLTRVNAPVKNRLLKKAEEILLSNEFILSKDVTEFENEFAQQCETKFCVGVGSGLDALFLSLKALNIKVGEEVIVPSHTFIATWLAVSRTGATVVPVDVRTETCNINPDLIQPAITPKTKAIVPVHLYGQICEMDAIMKIAVENNLQVVEDFAQAQGASYKNKVAGSFGAVNATSFYPSKNLGAFGDAGAVTTCDENLFRQLKMLRNYGSEKKYVHDVEGYNSRLDNLQAALLRIKLTTLKTENENRKRIAALYRRELAGVGDLVFQAEAAGTDSVWHLFVVRTTKRDELMQYLSNEGIGTIIHYPIAPFNQAAYKHLNLKRERFPVANAIADTCLSLPMFGDLQENEVAYVVEKVKYFFKH